ncbi:YhdP family phospholipid transporter [Thiolapillus sp.]
MFWGLFKRLGTLVTRLLYLIIIIGAAAKVLTFGFALYAETHKEFIEDLASRIVGTPVRFARIQTYWAGVTPRIWVRQLSLGENEQLALGDALVGFNLRALAHWRDNLPLNIRLEGTRIRVLRDLEGKTRILGMLKHQRGMNLPAYIQLENASLDWLDVKRDTTVHQEHLNVQLVTRGRHSSLHITSPRDGFQVRGEIDGSVSRGDWSGRFWSRGVSLQSEKLLQAYLPEGHFLTNLSLSYELWSYWERGSHSATRIRFDMDGVELHTPGGGKLSLSGLQGDLLYARQENDWILQLKGLELRANDRQWKPASLALQHRDGRLNLGISRLDLDALMPLLALLPNDTPLKLPLQAMAPRGTLADLRASAPAVDPLAAPVVQGSFHELSLHPWKKLPGIRNFSGRFQLRRNRVGLELDTRAARVDLTPLFRAPLDIDRLQGSLEWRRTGDNWLLQGSRLALDTPDLSTISRLRVERLGEQPAVMDIQTDFHDGNGAHAGRYYPVGIMKPALVNWLDTAIVTGHVTRGSFLFHGPLAKGHFPFHKTHDGHFEVAFEVEDLELAYRREWPPLKKVAGHVRFHNNDLDIHVNRGRIYGSRISQARASIPSLKPLKPIQVSGRLTGPGNDPLRLLRNTPLRHSFASRVKGMALDGNIDLKLDLDIPLHPPKKGTASPVDFTALVNFRDNRLILQQQELVLQHVQGKLKVDNAGLHASGLKAHVLEGAVQMDIAPDRHGTRITAGGRLPARGIITRYSWLQPLAMKGEADIKLSLDIPGLAREQDPTRLRLQSSLQGMTLELPPPLGKKAGQSIPFSLNMVLGTEASETAVSYGKRLTLALQHPPGGDAALTLKLSSLPLRQWLARFGDQAQVSDLPLRKLVLEIGELDAAPLRARDFRLDLLLRDGIWRGNINSDSMAGSLSFATDFTSRPLAFRLRQLAFKTLDEQAATPAAKPAEAETPSLSPEHFPPLDIIAETFHLNGADLGRLELHTRREDGHQLIDRLELHGKLADISAHGSWEPSAGSTTTWIKGVFTSSNMGRFLKKALHKDLLSGSRTYLSFDLSWPGAPFQFSLEQLQGEAQLDMARGRFLDFRPGLARILGLINFQSLGRRLKLDFKDVYKEGLAFDTILGNFQFDAGYLYTNNLEISGPSATILIAGSIDLINETYDQVLSVSPRLDATLPVAGAIVGGPAAGVAVLLAQQALSKKLEKAQRITYNITGTWDDPKVTRLTGEEDVRERPGSILDQ